MSFSEREKEAAPGLPFSIPSRLALLRLISLNARQQLFFQLSATLLKLLNLRLVTYVPLVTLKELDDVAVLVTKRVKALVRRH